jgi:cholesterol oxidase
MGAVGVTFKEKMAGGVSPGETDTQSGAAKAEGNILVMRGVVTINDIDSFITDPDHAGKLDVVMDWPPFGEGLQAPGGVFNLFSPSGNPALKLMVYEWGLNHAGQDYYFAGQKNVEVHPVRELWHDTTTLHTQVHRGKDKTGPVTGAGIISLSFSELLAMGRQFKPLNATSEQAGLEAVYKFGRFFLGELWETYIQKKGG